MKSRTRRKRAFERRKNSFLNLFLLFLLFFFLILAFIKEDFQKRPEKVEESLDLDPRDMPVVLSVSPTPYSKLRLPILMYHYVEHVTDKRDTIRQKMAVNPEEFEFQIKSLKDAGYTFHFLSEIPNIISGKARYHPKMIFLTFDDGYEDFYMVAYPILKKHLIKSTEFIVYDFIGRYNYMKDDQIKSIVSDGLVEIASHTLDHTDLKGASTESATLQITGSRKKLSEKFNVPVTSFAYPFGAFSTYTVDLAKQAGYTLAVSVIPGTQQGQENLFY